MITLPKVAQMALPFHLDLLLPMSSITKYFNTYWTYVFYTLVDDAAAAGSGKRKAPMDSRPNKTSISGRSEEGRFHRPPEEEKDWHNNVPNNVLGRAHSISDDIWAGIKYIHRELRGKDEKAKRERVNFKIPTSYNWDVSTEENYAMKVKQQVKDEQNCDLFSWSFEQRIIVENGTAITDPKVLAKLYPNDSLRRNIDYTYHSHYKSNRRLLQNAIVSSLIVSVVEDKITPGVYCERPEGQWIVFTAGAMGAGKTHVLKWLWTEGFFPLHSFVQVSVDRIRTRLPEYHQYMNRNQESAGTNTNMESGYIAELLLGAAIMDGRNVIVDGSLKSWEWHKSTIQHLRRKYDKIQVGIIHIEASEKMVRQRAKEREQKTGRHIPYKTLLSAFDTVPDSVEKLRDSVDVVFTILNDEQGQPPVLTSGGDWNLFSETFEQACAWIPGRKHH
ncbi:hypothetical protein SARC_13351 [Sphaeroforma arctica JP610]|uniref:Zeta toxin domain-containing protein n=1 Tax=Sphaeroforma arctica JP610 TaxID=667725 RepID=A0A0L0FBG5_9EUKA|nr:hypothetical protein SARC_13351 [Sphaeroforma arctica JP610]KNC74092.1 hypothetical protein SARC_13351 [Sphaeroforma arctica JP610]|eukprot:XP_014147994.1 hypothetical protein SARC_13351 [Sphaeroforma arctica JP610]